MRAISPYRRPSVLAAGALAIVAIGAMFNPLRRLTAAGEPESTLWLGADLSPFGSPGLPGTGGAKVRRVWSNSPARAAGIESGDIILQMNGAIVSTPADVQAMLAAPGSPRTTDMVILRNQTIRSVRAVLQETPDFALRISVTVVLLAAVFVLLYATTLDRVAVVGCGAVLSILLGLGLGFYDQQSAFASIRMGTLALLLGMGLITVALEETGVFTILARKVAGLSRGDWSRLMILLCLATFVMSTFVNNLTTILVILPVALALVERLDFDPRPFVIGMIVSSNLGGASSMIGDFPNMLIASETGRPFQDFLLYMMPPCLVQLAITLWILNRMQPVASRGRHGAGRPVHRSAVEVGTSLVPSRMNVAVSAMAAVIIAFLFCSRLGIPPATVALAGGFTVLLLWREASPRLIGKAGFGDILFFVGLFILVGCARASGLLDMIAVRIMEVSRGGFLTLALVLMWIAAFTTMFLNAGPTTALFVPVVMGLGIPDPHGLLWWALSLGVCAGSSATLTGATAGPVALTKIEEYARETATNPETSRTPMMALSFVDYAKVGVPLMFLFLVFSSAYIWALGALS